MHAEPCCACCALRQAAAESPFLDGKLEAAAGVLCVLRLPPSALGLPPAQHAGSRPGGVAGAGGGLGSGTPLVAEVAKEHALRSAVQVGERAETSAKEAVHCLMRASCSLRAPCSPVSLALRCEAPLLLVLLPSIPVLRLRP